MLVIFTDLDGSLLNHDDYSYEEAVPALRKIQDHRIPLVLCTSKTRKEVDAFRKETSMDEPFIVENGGGVFFPAAYKGLRFQKGFDNYLCIRLGISYHRIRSFMKQLGDDYPIRGFGDMAAEEIAWRTGLSLQAARLAKFREYTEPFLIDCEEQLPYLEEVAWDAGIKITRGGRFFHFISHKNDKGKAVRMTKAILESVHSSQVTSIGIGDSFNDLPMLKQVDIPVLIPNPGGSFEDIQLPNLIRAPFPGSRGWNETVCALLG